MERKLVTSTSLHALDITSYSSPIHSLGSPLSALSKSLSSKHIFGRRSRSTLKLSSATIASNVASPLSNVSTLPFCSKSTPRRTDSLEGPATTAPNQPERENAHQPSVTTASVLPTTDSAFSISPPAIKYANTFRTSSVSLITSTFRKFRARRTGAPHVNGDLVVDEGNASNTNVDDTVATPSLPPFQALSPFSQPTHPTALSTTQSMSTMSHLTAPGHALRSAYSDLTMHLRSEREPVPQFTRHQGSSSASLAEGAVVYPRSAGTPSSKQCPAQSTQKRDGEDGLGIVGLFYCAQQGKCSLIGGLAVDDKSTTDNFATMVEPDKDGMEDGESEEEEDDGIMIDAGIVILRESKVKPTPSPKKMVRRVPPPPFEELAVPKDVPQSPLTTGSCLIISSHPMSREKHTGSATETTASSGSGTEAGASGRSGSGAHSAFGSEHSHAHVDGVDYGDIAGSLGIPFPEGEEGNASNHISLGNPLPEGTSLPATASKQASPSNGVGSTLLHSPLLLGLGHPVSRLEHSQVSYTPSFLSSGKRTQSIIGLFARSTPASCSPSASSTSSSTRMKKSTTGLGMLGRRGRKERKEQGDVLLDYAQVASLMELEDGE